MENKKNILYIGPYNEYSNRGRDCLTNILSLHNNGHNIKVVPIYCNQASLKTTPPELMALELNNFSHYDISIQHCQPMEYCFNGNISKNIGIYDPDNLCNESVINSRLMLLDNVVVNSIIVFDHLRKITSDNIRNRIKLCPKYIDLDRVINYEKKYMDWTNKNKYYFYTELEFTDEYDWEKIIYTYFRDFAKRNCGLIVKTQQIEDRQYADDINEQIRNIAIKANVQVNKDNMPNVLNGIFDEETTMQLYNSVHCFIDATKTYKINSNLLIAAALQKDIICNSQLSFAKIFPQTYSVDAYPCNINLQSYDDLLGSSMYDNYYSMSCTDLKNNMMLAYINRYENNQNKISYKELQQYDIQNINSLLC